MKTPPDWIETTRQLFRVSTGAVGAFLCSAISGMAQVVPDLTLGNESSVVRPNVQIKGLNSNQIEGGAIRGANLFHSFSEFNVEQGGGVYFRNPVGIQRILTRVTGTQGSQILGTLGVLGNADLFLLNPNGILFGPEARLDLKGSLIGSTAHSIKFADGSEFSATNPQNSPLLSVNIPIGLQFGPASPQRPEPAGIINRSVVTALEETSEATPVGLEVLPTQTLALIGGHLNLEGGFLSAPSGRIELGSVSNNSWVSLTPIDSGWVLGYEGVNNFLDINLSEGATVSTTGEKGGAIQVVGRGITLNGNAQITSTTFGSQAGEPIEVRASELIALKGDATFIGTQTEGSGASGNLNVTTKRLNLAGGAYMGTPTLGAGQSGDLRVQASEQIEIIGTSSDQEFSSGLFSQVLAEGDGGNIQVDTQRLILKDGGVIDATTFDEGRAGDVTINATESIEILGYNPKPNAFSGISTDVIDEATGNGGNLTINTQRLIIQGGGQIATATTGAGDAGMLKINASELVQLAGTRPDIDPEFGSSGLFVSTQSLGNGGSLQVNTAQLIVEDGAKISANAFSSGKAGNISLAVRQLKVASGGLIRAGSSGAGDGGTLDINASESVEVTGSRILGDQIVNSSLLTRAEAEGNAGILSIRTPLLSVNNTARVSVGSIGTGAAGNLNIDAQTIRLSDQGRLSAINNAGFGNINLQTSYLEMRRNSLINTSSQGGEPGGNITISTDNLVALENSDIRANAINSSGGRVQISAQGIFGTQFRQGVLDTPESDITASSELGAEFSGTVEIKTPEVDPSSGLVELPETPVDPDQVVARDLCSPEKLAGSGFVVTGRGGLPASPSDLFTNETMTLEWAAAGQETQPAHSTQGSASTQIASAGRGENFDIPLREAQGWMVAGNGQVILTAHPSVVTPTVPSLTAPSCVSAK
jgi:filamentous hemagglutinin family protein